MTCIVGLVHDGDIYMGADSAATNGMLNQVNRKDEKVFKKGNMLFDFTSSYRMGQLLKYNLNIPRPFVDESLETYMYTRFIDSVRDCFKKGGFSRVMQNEEHGGTFLVGVEGRLFKISGDFQVGESMMCFDACGCGEDLAKGAAYVLTKHDVNDNVPPEIIVTEALEAASVFSAGVGGPLKILKLEGIKEENEQSKKESSQKRATRTEGQKRTERKAKKPKKKK